MGWLHTPYSKSEQKNSPAEIYGTGIIREKWFIIRLTLKKNPFPNLGIFFPKIFHYKLNEKSEL